MDLKYGDKIEVYRNLHKKCFSVRHKGRVVMHLQDHEQLSLTNVKFVVQPAGRARPIWYSPQALIREGKVCLFERRGLNWSR